MIFAISKIQNLHSPLLCPINRLQFYMGEYAANIVNKGPKLISFTMGSLIGPNAIPWNDFCLKNMSRFINRAIDGVMPCRESQKVNWGPKLGRQHTMCQKFKICVPPSLSIDRKIMRFVSRVLKYSFYYKKYHLESHLMFV